METHSGDSPINRFFSFWGAIGSFVFFGLVVLLFAGLERGISSGDRSGSIDDARRTQLDRKSIADQEALVSAWKKNDDGTYEVPAAVALPLMADKMAKPSKSAVPVPGTKAAEEAAKAAAAQAAPAADATEPSQNP